MKLTKMGISVAAAVAALLFATFGTAMASAPTAADGTFTQTAVTGFEIRIAGANVIIEQTTQGVISGTLSGTIEDTVRVVIHSDGTFEAKGTTIGACSVDGKQGLVGFAVTDQGEQISPDSSRFTGRAVITRTTGDLSGLSGRLDIAGTVDIPSGLSTIGYSGHIHLHP